MNVCFEVATTVSPVVSNCSPEGNVPEDAILGKSMTDSDIDKGRSGLGLPFASYINNVMEFVPRTAFTSLSGCSH